MIFQLAELAHQLSAFGVVGGKLSAGEVTEMQTHIPLEGRPALGAAKLRMSNGLGKALVTVLYVRSDVTVGCRPQSELLWLIGHTFRPHPPLEAL